MSEANFRSRRWTPEEHDVIRELAGKESYKAIGIRLGRTEYSIESRARVLGLRGMNQGSARAGSKPVKCPVKASYLHIEDLERAGYSPGHAELRIFGEATILRPSAPSPLHSGSGSPAAMCVGS